MRKTRSQKQSIHSPSKAFPSHKCNAHKMMHNKFKNQTPPCSGARNKAKQTLSKQSFSLSQVQRSQNDALSKSCAQQVQKSNTSLFDHFSPQNLLPLVGTCTHQAPPEAETPPEQMLCNECNTGGVSESIQGYKDMSNI